MSGPYYSDSHVRLFVGDAREVLRSLPDESVQCCVTSPPYWGLRDYGHDGQLGLEPTPEDYVANMVEVFREVRRVLREDGTLWLNLGDSYASDMKGSGGASVKQLSNAGSFHSGNQRLRHGLKPKDLVGIPWRVAFALQADGWYLRSDIIWAKPNPMPESVRDRPTKSHEYVFLLSKSATYFYDADAVAEPSVYPGDSRHPDATRNRRSVWTIATKPYPEAHFATFPPELPELCVKAGTSQRGACPQCGAPWGRVVVRTGVVLKRPAVPITDRRADKVNDKRTALSGTQVAPATSRTIGWSPSCECEQHEDEDGVFIERPNEPTDRYVYEPEPCVVLDPFAGAGTTLLTAKNLNRQGVGIEINPDYADLICKRVAQQVLAL